MQTFAEQWLTDGDLLVVNGYSPAASAKVLANQICSRFSALAAASGGTIPAPRTSFSSLFEQAAYIRRAFGGGSGHGESFHGFDPGVLSCATYAPRRLYLVVHSIDAPALRSPAAQDALRCAHVFFVSSSRPAPLTFASGRPSVDWSHIFQRDTLLRCSVQPFISDVI